VGRCCTARQNCLISFCFSLTSSLRLRFCESIVRTSSSRTTLLEKAAPLGNDRGSGHEVALDNVVVDCGLPQFDRKAFAPREQNRERIGSRCRVRLAVFISGSFVPLRESVDPLRD
jgi:hypothetical protein